MSFYTQKYGECKYKKNDFVTLFAVKSYFKNCKKILDVGCSTGSFLEIDPKRIFGVDIDPDAIKIAKRRGLQVKLADGESLPFNDATFDGVFCSHVLEHVNNPLGLLKEIKRVLKKGGRIFIITPDYIMTHHRYHQGFWSDYSHKNCFTPESLNMIFYDAGLKVEQIYWIPKLLTLIKSDFLRKTFGLERIKTFLINLQKLIKFYKNRDLVVEAVNEKPLDIDKNLKLQ